ncbi:MAG: DUF1566 domain-containing protein [Rhodocyclaceae bacterium]|nr:DUF1566 domain-containing protein [Rhodocyclaceae bacterium]
MRHRQWLSAGSMLLGIAVLSVSPDTLAALWNRGGGLIYDDTLHVTWLSDADFAKTSGFDADGKLNWYDARAWADGLVFRGYSDWRLPSSSRNELYVLSQRGDLAGFFTNIHAEWTDSQYWYAEEFNADSAQMFYWTYSRWNAGSKSSPQHAWLLRDGDVAPVPEPSEALMMLTGLGLLGAARSRSRGRARPAD